MVDMARFEAGGPDDVRRGLGDGSYGGLYERPDDDVSELRWFAPAELPPPNEIAFDNVARVLQLWRDQQA